MDYAWRRIPFVLRVAATSEASRESVCVDTPPIEDPLPARVATDAEGYIRFRRTMTTDVQRETTDDN